MKKNIVIGVLTILLLSFLVNSIIIKQENDSLREALDICVEGLPEMQLEMSSEYYDNFLSLKKSGCSQVLLDSIWNNSLFLKPYERAKRKVDSIN